MELVQTVELSKPPDALVAEPANCESCASACPLKKRGCAYDTMRMVQYVDTSVKQFGIEFPGAVDLLVKLKPEAVECRKKITDQVRVHNESVRVAEMAARIVQRQLGQPAPVKRNGSNGHSATLSERVAERQAVVAPTEVAVLAPPVEAAEDDGDDEDDGLYVGDEDKKLAAEMAEKQEPNVYAYPIGLSVPVDKIAVMRPEWERVVSSDPFKGARGIVARRHKERPELARVTLWYEGPPPEEAGDVIRERMKPFRDQLKRERRMREGNKAGVPATASQA